MSKFITSLSAFIAGTSLVNSDVQALEQGLKNPFGSRLDPVSLRPLNMPGDNLYAAHRSHSSHSSHSTHSSGSGSYSAPSRTYTAPSKTYSPPSPAYSAPKTPYSSNFGTSGSNSLGGSTGSRNPVDAGRPSTVSPISSDFDPNNKKLMELIRRVQMGLIIKGYEPGTIDGVMGEQTRLALKLFQSHNSLPADGMMGTQTLNALGVIVPK